MKTTAKKIISVFMFFFLLGLGSSAYAQSGSCLPPWAPTKLTNSTTAYGIVTIEGAPAAEGDMVAAFVDGQCRGLREITLNGGNAYVNIAIQGESPEEASFKLWDADMCRALDIDFITTTAPGTIIGSAPDFLPLDATLPVGPVLAVSDTELFVEAQGGEVSVDVYNGGDGDLEWSAEIVSGDWLSISGDNFGVNNGTITIVAGENNGTERTATIEFTAPSAKDSPQTVSIVQESAPLDNRIVLAPEKTTVHPQEPFGVTVNIAGENIWAVSVVVSPETGIFGIEELGNYGEGFFSSDPEQRFDIDIAKNENEEWEGARSARVPGLPISGSGVFAENLAIKALANTYGFAKLTSKVVMADRWANELPASASPVTLLIDDFIHVQDGEIGGNTISGKVTFIDGSPAAGVEISISIGGHSFSTTTDENGVFSFDELRDLNPGEEFTVAAGFDSFGVQETVGNVDNPVELDMVMLNGSLADLNKDGEVNIADFVILSNVFGLSEGDPGYDDRADLKDDGIIDIFDLALLGSHWRI